LTKGRINGKNKQLAIGNWQLARKPKPLAIATLCRLDSGKKKKGLKLGQIGTTEKRKKKLRPLG
jgi:hypothetical protein